MTILFATISVILLIILILSVRHYNTKVKRLDELNIRTAKDLFNCRAEKSKLENQIKSDDTTYNKLLSELIRHTDVLNNQLYLNSVNIHFYKRLNNVIQYEEYNKHSHSFDNNINHLEQIIDALYNVAQENARNITYELLPHIPMTMDVRFYICKCKRWIGIDHGSAEQIKRVENAIHPDVIIKEKINNSTYRIQGTTIDAATGKKSIYETSLLKCTCDDFKYRKNPNGTKFPCKHIYALAIYLSDKKLQEHLESTSE